MNNVSAIHPEQPDRQVAKTISNTILQGFEEHFDHYQRITAGAQERFEQADWIAVQQASRERIYYYDQQVFVTFNGLRSRHKLNEFDQALWQRVKFEYAQRLLDHQQAELAESFYNSVFCRLFDRKYYTNDNIFVRSSVSTEYMDMNSIRLAYRCYYPAEVGLRATIAAILTQFGLGLPFENIHRDIRNIVHCLRQQLPKGDRKAGFNFHINVLSSLFFRNKSAYIIGKVINDYEEFAFAVPILNNEKGGIYVDTLLLEERDLRSLFSFSRAYFMVDHPVPAGVVDFLLDFLPRKSKAELYTAIGFHKHGKTVFYRDFLNHLKYSTDQLIFAPGIKGMVMAVFTLPSYPYVFKVIRDYIAPPKEVNKQTVMEKYQLIKQHDRLGYMADSLEYSDVALPRDKFSRSLLEELHENCANSLEVDGNQIVIKHMYIERRLIPLNLYVQNATDEELNLVILRFGEAIKQMAAANIFPGDMLLKNFGVTQFGRVIFYDYDEICYMTECNFRHFPEPRYPEDELSAEPWYSVAPNDVFPEEFGRFLLVNPRIRKLFMTHHRELLDPEFWKQKQANIIAGIHEDVFPYSQGMRFNRN
jgi:isocitrate dehydrogenase kinase/phosphatase